MSTLAVFLVSFIAPFASFIPQTSAMEVTTITWDGGGADNNFSTALNWSTDAIPINGDVIGLDLSILVADEWLNNDMIGLSLGGINVTNTSATYKSYGINGLDFSLTGDIDVNSGTLTIDGPNITISSSGVSFSGRVYIVSNLSIGSNSLTIDTDSNFSGALSGSGSINIIPTEGGGQGAGGCDFGVATARGPFAGDNSGFSGSLTIGSDVGLSVSDVATNIAKYASSIIVQSGGSLGFILSSGSDMSLTTNINMAGGTLSVLQLPATEACSTPSLKTLTLSGNITATGNVGVEMRSANISMTGTITGSSYFVATEGIGTGSETLTIGTSTQKSAEKTTNYEGDNTSTNPTVFDNNIVVVKSGATLGSVYVYGGILKGNGIVGVITMESGTVAPGESPGCLTSGALSYLGGELEIELGGTAECTGYDQQIVVGGVALGSATTLTTSLFNSFKPALNSTYTIIKNDASDEVTGTFTGLAEGATFKVGEYTLGITYKGGDGNDVVLSVTAVPASATVADTGVGTLMTSTFGVLIMMALAGGVLAGSRKFNKIKR